MRKTSTTLSRGRLKDIWTFFKRCLGGALIKGYTIPKTSHFRYMDLFWGNVLDVLKTLHWGRFVHQLVFVRHRLYYTARYCRLVPRHHAANVPRTVSKARSFRLRKLTNRCKNEATDCVGRTSYTSRVSCQKGPICHDRIPSTSWFNSTGLRNG